MTTSCPLRSRRRQLKVTCFSSAARHYLGGVAVAAFVPCRVPRPETRPSHQPRVAPVAVSRVQKLAVGNAVQRGSPVIDTRGHGGVHAMSLVKQHGGAEAIGNEAGTPRCGW